MTVGFGNWPQQAKGIWYVNKLPAGAPPGQIVYYNGTLWEYKYIAALSGYRWLTVQQYTIDFQPWAALAGSQKSATLNNLFMSTVITNTYDFYMEDFSWNVEVITTNNSSNYWRLDLYRGHSGNVESVIVQPTTQADTVNRWNPHVTPVNAALGIPSDYLTCHLVRVGTPGNALAIGASLTGRLIGS